MASRAVMTISPASLSSDPSIRTLPAEGRRGSGSGVLVVVVARVVVAVDRIDRDLHQVRELGRVQPFRGGGEVLVDAVELVGPFRCEAPAITWAW